MTRRKVTAVLGVVLLMLYTSAAGCPSAATWLSLIANLIPIVAQTYTGLEGAISGVPVPAAEVTAVNTLSAQGQDLLNKISDLVKNATAVNTVSQASQIQADIKLMQADVNAFLTDLNVKNSTHFAEYSSFANVLLADAADIAGLIPVFQTSTTGTASARMTESRQMTSARYSKAKALQGIFTERLASLPKKF